MVIETLPLLNSDYDEWDWRNNTCSYWTPDVYDAYYMALARNDGYGYCRNFACDVWNRIRYKLIGGIYREAGLEEDLSFVPDGALTMKFGEEDNEQFTAWRFNDAVANVDMLNIFRFNWERTNNMPGFLGRRYVRGFADYGEQSDYVYAWYILELVEKANKLIRILKNEYTFSELYGETSKILTISNSSVAVPRAGILDFAKEINAEYLATVATAGVLAQNAQEKSFSGYTGKMNTVRTMEMNVTGAGMTHADALTDRAKTVTMTVAGKGTTISGSILSDVPFAGRMECVQMIVTDMKAQIDVSNTSEVRAVNRGRSTENAQLYAIDEMLMGAKSGGASHALSLLKKLGRIAIETKTFADSHSMMELSVMDRILETGTGMGKSMQNSVMQYFVAQYIKKDIYAVTIPKARTNTVFAHPMTTDSTILSALKAEENICRSMVIAWTGNGETLGESELGAVKIKWLNTQKHGKSNENGSEIIYCAAVRMETQRRAESIAQGTIQKGITLLFETEAQEKTKVTGEIVPLQKRWFTWDKYEKTKQESTVDTANAGVFEITCVSGTAMCCVLDLESTKQSWYDPVKNGTDLYIRNAYQQWKENTNVHLDGGIYYEPEQTETNVYIRSTESLKGV